MMNRSLLLVGMLCLSLCLSYRTVIADDQLLLTTLSIPPLSYEENGKLKGIGTDIVIEAFARMHRPIAIKVYPSARAQKMMQMGEADATFPYTKTPEREIFAIYPNEPLINHPVVLVVRKDSAIQFDGNLKNLSQYTFGLLRGTKYTPEFEAAVNRGVITKLEEISEERQNILKLVHKRIDIVVGTRLTLFFAAKELGQQDAIKELFPALKASSPGYIAFSRQGKATGIVTQFDAVLKEMRLDGTYDRIVQSYLK